ncbi:hypothetical protein BH09BAC5_BH09BAC5_13240 [soil metagenome]
MRYNLFPLFLFLLSLSNCRPDSNQISAVNPNTQKLSSYLKINFDDSIPTDEHLFILITKKENAATEEIILSRLKKELLNAGKNNYTVIIGADNAVSNSIETFENKRIDWDGAIEKLNLNLSGVTLLKTSEKNVIDQLNLDKDVFGMEQKFIQ